MICRSKDLLAGITKGWTVVIQGVGAEISATDTGVSTYTATNNRLTERGHWTS
jgi:hypothetical protein